MQPEVIHDICGRLERIQAVQVEFTSELRSNTDPQIRENMLRHYGERIHKDAFLPTTIIEINLVRLYPDALYVKQHPSPESAADLADRFQDLSGAKITAWLPDRVERLRDDSAISRTDVKVLGEIADGGDARYYPYPVIVDRAIGLSLIERGFHRLSPDELSRAEVVAEDERQITLRCETADGAHHFLTFDRSLGYALVHSKTHRGGAGYSELTCDDFEQLSGVHLPRTVIQRNVHLDSTGQMREALTQTLTIKRWTLLNATDDAEQARMIRWPKGSRVIDVRTKEVFEVEEEGMQLTDEFIFAELERREWEKAAREREAQERIDRIIKDESVPASRVPE